MHGLNSRIPTTAPMSAATVGTVDMEVTKAYGTSDTKDSGLVQVFILAVENFLIKVEGDQGGIRCCGFISLFPNYFSHLFLQLPRKENP